MNAEVPSMELLIEPLAVARMLSVPVSWVYGAAKDGRLPCVRNGRYVRFRPSDIQAYIDRGGAA